MSNQFNILDYTYGPLLKTGQTTDYTPVGRTTKDDGGFQRGITGSKADAQYVVLTTGQYAGTTNITVNAKVDAHSNECVFYKVTGLMWSRTSSPAIYGTGTENLLWDDTAGSNEDIFNYCDQANLSGLSGFSDWRLPNSVELATLIINVGPNAAPNSTAFPTILAETHYTSTTRTNSTDKALGINFAAGSNDGFLTKTITRLKTILCRLGVE